MSKLLVLTLLFFSSQALASFTIRGGGDSVVCYNDIASMPEVIEKKGRRGVILDDRAKKAITSVRLLDLYLAEQKGQDQSESFARQDWKEIFNSRIKKIEKASNVSELLRFAMKELEGHISYVDNLVDINDDIFEDILVLPTNCQLLQVAVQGVTEGGISELYYNKFLVEYLEKNSPLHRAALEMHELLRFVTLNTVDPDPVGDTLKIVSSVKYVFSKKFEEDSLHEMVNELTKRQVIHHAKRFWSLVYLDKYRPKTRHPALREAIDVPKAIDSTTREMRILAPTNAREFHIILNGTYGADLPKEGGIYVNGKKVADLFGAVATGPINNQSKFFNIPIKYLESGEGNVVQFRANRPGDFHIDTVFLRTVCRKRCKLKNHFNIIPDGLLSRVPGGWDSPLLRKLHRKVNGWAYDRSNENQCKN